MYKAIALLVLGMTALVGCNKSQPDAGVSADVSAVGAKYLVDKELPDAQPVADAIQAAEDKAEVTVVGRIGGDEKPLIEDLAAFTIVDPSLTPCNEMVGDTCETPWDYCCDSKKLKTHSVMVKFVDDKGSVVPVDARKLFEVEPLQTVVVKGKLQKDKSGQTALIAEKMYVRK
jgi:hypothetical protein